MLVWDGTASTCNRIGRLRPIVVLAMACCISAVPALAQDTTRHPIHYGTTYEDLQLFSQVLNELRDNHPDSLDSHVLVMAAIDGMLHAADPHSFLIPVVRLSASKAAAFRMGQLVPVPLSFVQIPDGFVVTGAAEGSPAARAGILPGDRLVAADSVRVTAASVEELEISLAGPAQSEAVLTLERRRLDGSIVTLTRRIARAMPGPESAVSLAMMLDKRTGYLRIGSFLSPKAGDDVRAALGRLHDQGMQRLVIDLRDNAGGVIEAAAHVAGEFLPAGTLVYTSEGRKHDAIDTVRVKRSFFHHEDRYPVVVLINGGTASAAELVAGALQDHDRATIVGRPSFGKALLMKPFRLTDGSVLMLVVGHVRTPCGRLIQRSYRGLDIRDYYNRALVARDTTGLPSCKTDAGRTVYGGGGIFPDVPLAQQAPTPVWLDRARLDDLPLLWVGGFLDAHTGDSVSLDSFVAAPALSDSALVEFRAFAASRGDSVPIGPAADEVVRRLITLAIAQAKWGPTGYYRAAATSDPDVTAAVAAFDHALVASSRPAGSSASSTKPSS